MLSPQFSVTEEVRSIREASNQHQNTVITISLERTSSFHHPFPYKDVTHQGHNFISVTLALLTQAGSLLPVVAVKNQSLPGQLHVPFHGRPGHLQAVVFGSGISDLHFLISQKCEKKVVPQEKSQIGVKSWLMLR